MSELTGTGDLGTQARVHQPLVTFTSRHWPTLVVLIWAGRRQRCGAG
jgi:hypothetical protein